MGKGLRLACGLAFAGAVACGGIARGTSSDGGADGSAGSHDDGGPGTASDGAADGGAGSHDDGGPGTASDGGASSCPATYADVPQFSACSGYVSCDYEGQFDCTCTNVSTNPPSNQWECMNFSCTCSQGNDAGCVNEPCATDADCPSGQHCGPGHGGNVCSLGCMGPGGSQAACPAGATCVSFAP